MMNPVEIVNIALGKLGADHIMSLDDDAVEARIMKHLYRHVVPTELSAYAWKFAMKRAQLPALEQSPFLEYKFAYMVPYDCLTVIEVGGINAKQLPQTEGRPAWSIERGFLLTNFEPPLAIRYITSDNDTSNFSPLFVEALACKLAVEGCERITQSNTKKNFLMQEYQGAIERAIKQDAIEKAPDVMMRGNWLKAREGGSHV